jgi:tetratricopeptide (TPR) repeat protein
MATLTGFETDFGISLIRAITAQPFANQRVNRTWSESALCRICANKRSPSVRFCPKKFRSPRLRVVSYAYATRRAESIAAAKEILLNAEAKFPKEAIIKYNLACYFCQTEDIETAKNYLKKAFEIDPSWRSSALEDEDLKPLWDSMRAG